MTETWLPMPDYEGLYEVSNLGRVRSLYFSPPRAVAIIRDSNDYPVIMLSKDGKRTPKTLHRMVCRAFHGEPTILHKEAAHLNGVRKDCRADNLKWTTKVENHFHKRAHGTHRAGERHPKAILTEAAVREIRANPGKTKEFTERFGCTSHAIDDVRRRRNWRHVA